MKRFLTPGAILFLVIWLVLLFGGRSRFFHDPGTFWHTVVGELIFARGFFDTDFFTFTRDGETWLPHQWLGECLMALAHRVGELDTLLLLSCTVLATLYSWLGMRLIRSGIHWSLAAVLVALAMMASAGHFHVRPHLATIVFFAISYAILTDVEAERAPIQRLYWLIPISLVWTNFHGGILGGLGTILLAILGWIVVKRLGWWGCLNSTGQVWLALGVWFAAAAMVFVNPWGSRMPEVWLDIYEMKLLPKLVLEHSPVDLTSLSGWTIITFGVVYLGLLASTYPERPKIVWLLPLIWLLLSLSRVRHAPLFSVAALIAIADLFPFTKLADYWERTGNDLFERPHDSQPRRSWGERLAGWTLPGIMVIVALGLQIAKAPVPLIGHGWARLDPTVWPTELIPALREHQDDLERPAKIFNDYTYGGFLIYHAPGYRVFVDDRCELFGDSWLQEFVLGGGSPDFGVLNQFIKDWEGEFGRFDFALLSSGSNFDLYFSQSPYWELLQPGQTANFYRRRR